MQKIIVVGSGLAGLSAAIRLQERGYGVTVLESLNNLGGRTSSWVDDGLKVESGLHRYLGFYSHLPGLLRAAQVNINDIIVWEDKIDIRLPGGKKTTLALAPLRTPIGLVKSTVGDLKFLNIQERLAILRMIARMMRDYKRSPQEMDSRTVLDYAEAAEVPHRAIIRLLVPLTEGIFFVPIEKYSAYNFAGLFMPYLFSLIKMRVGAFNGGMSDVLIQPLADWIEANGGRVIKNTPVNALKLTHGRVNGVITHSGHLEADYVVLAASIRGAKDILTASLPPASLSDFSALMSLSTTPSVTFHIELSQPSVPYDRTTFGPTTCMASFSEQSRTTFTGSQGRLSVILANPKHYIHIEPAMILKDVVRDANLLGMPLKDTVISYRKVVIEDDFYSLQPGSEQLRPMQRTKVPGLVLAGDYTRQPYLATMEGAVYSGSLAADTISSSHKQ